MAAPTEQKKPEAKKKTKRSSAAKRNLQSQRQRQRNRSYRAAVLTAVRSLENSLAQKQGPEVVKEKLSAIYSLMDKGVKKGVYKLQKASRTKSRLSARVI